MKEIKLTQGKVTLVDDNDFEELNKHKWFARKDYNTFYVLRQSSTKGGIKRRTLLMHRIIMNCPEKLQIDHIDGDGLNNQKANLRVVTTRQNKQNIHIKTASKYPGVSWHKTGKTWQANIRIGNRKRYLGMFEKEEDAYAAYLVAEKVLVT